MGVVRANVPFHRAESKYNVEQVDESVTFHGGHLDRVGLTHILVLQFHEWCHTHKVQAYAERWPGTLANQHLQGLQIMAGVVCLHLPF